MDAHVEKVSWETVEIHATERELIRFNIISNLLLKGCLVTGLIMLKLEILTLILLLINSYIFFRCYEDCVFGTCSNHPDYICKCDLGWTGKDCSINCGCHNHSNCDQGIGICDKCQESTAGKFCHLCQ